MFLQFLILVALCIFTAAIWVGLGVVGACIYGKLWPVDGLIITYVAICTTVVGGLSTVWAFQGQQPALTIALISIVGALLCMVIVLPMFRIASLFER